MAATIDDLLNELRLAREGQETSNDEARKQAERERRLLGQSEKQYEEMLEQRKRTEESKKQMDELESILGEDAKNNRQYQDAQKKYNKEQLKSLYQK